MAPPWHASSDGTATDQRRSRPVRRSHARPGKSCVLRSLLSSLFFLSLSFFWNTMRFALFKGSVLNGRKSRNTILFTVYEEFLLSVLSKNYTLNLCLSLCLPFESIELASSSSSSSSSFKHTCVYHPVFAPSILNFYCVRVCYTHCWTFSFRRAPIASRGKHCARLQRKTEVERARFGARPMKRTPCPMRATSVASNGWTKRIELWPPYCQGKFGA